MSNLFLEKSKFLSVGDDEEQLKACCISHWPWKLHWLSQEHSELWWYGGARAPKVQNNFLVNPWLPHVQITFVFRNVNPFLFWNVN